MMKINSFEEFKDYMKENIKNYMPEDYADSIVDIQQVTKNNNLILNGLTIRNEGQEMVPTIYLEGYYEEYRQGRELDSILNKISEVYLNAEIMKQPFQFDDIKEFNKIKDRIICKVVGVEANKERLQEMPHRIENDIALEYHILISNDNGNIGTVKITNEMCQMHGTNEEELHNISLCNTERLFPQTFRKMEDVIKDIMMREMFENPELMTNDEKKMLDGMFASANTDNSSMYVLSNEEGVDGAAVLFYPGIREEIAAKLGSDYFVLPSSLHETLIVPNDGLMSPKELREMVKEVNATQVAPEERLTDNVYFYNRKTKELTIAGTEKNKNMENNRAGNEIKLKQMQKRDVGFEM